MWVVPISTLLDSDTMTEFMPHEEMKRKGLLVEWKPSLKGRVLFCSHTWLRSNSPDNEAGQKFCLLKTLLSRVRAGKFSCGPDWQSELVYKAGYGAVGIFYLKRGFRWDPSLFIMDSFETHSDLIYNSQQYIEPKTDD